MKFIKVSNFNGFIFRKDGLTKRNITVREIELIMEGQLIDESDSLLSFGPSFGGEAAKEFSDRLEKIGLVYTEDYFAFDIDLPDWLELGAKSPTDP